MRPFVPLQLSSANFLRLISTAPRALLSGFSPPLGKQFDHLVDDGDAELYDMFGTPVGAPQRVNPRLASDGSEVFDDIPDFTEYRDTSVRPVVFTPERPSPLWGVNLDDIGSEYMHQSRLSGGRQDPIVPVCPERHGIPEVFAKRLEKEFGITHLTPVQARALQHIYGGNDAAICAPTGSGKTFAFCVALLSKIMREGPPVSNSTLILSPSTDLCYQTERWLRRLWWHPNDERLCVSITEEQTEGFVHSLLIGQSNFSTKLRRFIGGKGVDERPSILIATPEALLKFCEARKKVLQRTQPNRNFSLVPIFPYLSTVIVDEVDSVLPPHSDKAPGNLLMNRYLTNSKFQAPLQRIFVSATLSATTVNHVRRFLRKSLMAHKSAHLFETEMMEMNGETNGVRGLQQKGSARGLSAENRNDGRGTTTSGSKAASTRLAIPENVSTEFFSADRLHEQRKVIETVVIRDLPPRGGGTHEADQRKGAGIKSLVVLPESADPVMFVNEVLQGLGTVDYSLWTNDLRGTNDEDEDGDGEAADTQQQRDEIARLPANVPLPLRLVNPRHRRRIIRGGLASEEEINEYLASSLRANAAAAASPKSSVVVKGHCSPVANDDRSDEVTFILCSKESVRGADIPKLTHMFLMAPPENALDLAHMIGRVGRMGSDGIACVVTPRSTLRHLSQYCDVLGIPFKLHKRFKDVDVHHQRIVAEAREEEDDESSQ